MDARATIERDDAETWATWFRALGDPTRLLILNLLATAGRPMTVGEIVDAVDIGQSTVSHHLKILGDGVILKSQAQLAASLRATWSDSQLSVAERLLRVIEARATAHDSATLVWPDSEGDEDLIGDLVAAGATRRPNGVLAPVDRIAAISTLLTAKGRGPVTASRPDFVFETSCGPYEALAQRVKN